MKLVSMAEMRAIEQAADAGGLSYRQMMQKAGEGLARRVVAVFGQGGEVIGLVGAGNNGGDTLVALTSLIASDWKCHAFLARPRPEGDELTRAFEEAGGHIVADAELPAVLAGADVLLDGVLGTGTQLPLKPPLADTLAAIKRQLAEMDAQETPFVVAVDCPSGVDSDSGEAAPETIPADLTVCMAAVKSGLLKLPAFELVGELSVVDIGLPDDLAEWRAVHTGVMDMAQTLAWLPERAASAHKGTFGTALVVAGSTNYTGAALLAGKAAYRAGAGLVQMAVPNPLYGVLAGVFPEATWLLLPHEGGVFSASACDVLRKNMDRATAVLLGPGWGQEDATLNFLKRLLGLEAARGAVSLGFIRPEVKGATSEALALPPAVIDADGLKLLAKIEGWQNSLPENAVLTPHPGEMAVLTGLSVDDIQADRVGAARRFAAEWQHVVVLKGAFTVVAEPGGQVMVIPVATAGLARAGTGDVLAGLVVGLRAQKIAPFEAACAAAWIHGQAGLRAEAGLGSQAAVLAGDVLAAIPEVLSQLEW